MATKKKSEEREFTRALNLRSYVYTAYVNKLTGKIIKITAGCRLWESFAEARKHYEGRAGNGVGDGWGDGRAHLMRDGQAVETQRYYQRAEARALLNKLEGDVMSFQNDLKYKKRRAAQLLRIAKKAPAKKRK